MPALGQNGRPSAGFSVLTAGENGPRLPWSRLALYGRGMLYTNVPVGFVGLRLSIDTEKSH